MGRPWMLGALGLGLLAALAFCALTMGHFRVPAWEVWDILLSRGEVSSAMARNVVLNVRLPRILLALLAGAGLGAAGVAFQALFSNPLATPDTLGVASGASFGAAAGILLGLPPLMIQLFALAAGLGAVALVYSVSRIRGGSTVIMLILSGMVVSALFSALLALVKYVADPQDQLPSITFWLMGSLSGISRSAALLSSPLIIGGIVVLWFLRWKLDALTLPEDEIRSLGLPVGMLRALTVLAGAAVTASVVSLCGLIGWVGLLVPHGARMAFGGGNRTVIPASIIGGALFLLAADTAARCLTASEIPVSVLTAITGAPVFIALLRRSGGMDR